MSRRSAGADGKTHPRCGRGGDQRANRLPAGRVRPDWQGGADWACLTGSAQFAYSYLRLALMERGEAEYLKRATSLIDFVVATQQDENRGRAEQAYGVRGSYPFRVKGCQAATMPNWAAKFLVDAELLLDELGGFELALPSHWLCSREHRALLEEFMRPLFAPRW